MAEIHRLISREHGLIRRPLSRSIPQGRQFKPIDVPRNQDLVEL
jgi:hypothetical protein